MKFDFDSINLVPKKCVVDSRSEIHTGQKLGKFNFKLPVVPANMECVINMEIAKMLATEGYFYILHRFYQTGEIIEFIRDMNKLEKYVSISIGVNQESYDFINKIVLDKLKVDFITIDISHGHAIKMEKMLGYVKKMLPDTFVIAGNVSTGSACKDLESWGADAIKCGIGPGLSCTTWSVTGFGSRNCQASTVLECSKSTKLPIIADGGIRNPGDIAKSLVLGAKFCMIGGMLSGYSDSPGNIVEIDGKIYKEYWGSASSHQSGKKNRIEGKNTLVEFKNSTLLEGLDYLKECLESSISFAGGRDISAFDTVEWK